MRDGDFDMMHLMSSLGSTALDRLTATRREEGHPPPEVEEMLGMIGVFWDETDEEYFSVEGVLREVMEDTVKKYSNTADLDH